MGQRRHGELLLVLEDRAHGQQNVQDTRRSKSGCIRLHRTLLQCQTKALDDRLSERYGVREAGRICLTACHPNRVQAMKTTWYLQSHFVWLRVCPETSVRITKFSEHKPD